MFDNFVSLGERCPVALSMGRYGLRSWSGPFDWLVTEDFSWVLYYMENNFVNFLELDNLEYFKGCVKRFKEKNSNFLFVHELSFSLEENYEYLKKKYQKRTERFIKETAKTTCFIRTISKNEQLEYVKAHSLYIESVIKKRNKHNKIIFLIDENVKNIEKYDIPFDFYQFSLKDDGIIKRTREWRKSLFSNSKELLEFCVQHFDNDIMLKNINFDYDKELFLFKKSQQNLALQYNLALQLLKTDFKRTILPPEIIIYGIGDIGIQFYKRIKELCKIKCFVEYGKKQGVEVDGVPILVLDKIESKNIPFVVTSVHEFEEICKVIKHYNADAVIISLEDILNN